MARAALLASPVEVSKPTLAAMKYVRPYVRQALSERLDDSTDEFEVWLEDKHSGLARRISKRRDCRWAGGEVNAAIVEFGWQSYQSIGQCFDAQMRSYLRDLPLD